MQRILVIEDYAPMRRNLAVMLEMEGYAVIQAEDGEAGLAAVAASAPNLVLCDVMMPEMDGHAVLRAVRADDATATLPFIFLTVIRALQAKYAEHRKWAKIAAPIWLYVSFTGVLVYLMLYVWFPGQQS